MQYGTLQLFFASVVIRMIDDFYNNNNYNNVTNGINIFLKTEEIVISSQDANSLSGHAAYLNSLRF